MVQVDADFAADLELPVIGLLVGWHAGNVTQASLQARNGLNERRDACHGVTCSVAIRSPVAALEGKAMIPPLDVFAISKDEPVWLGAAETLVQALEIAQTTPSKRFSATATWD